MHPCMFQNWPIGASFRNFCFFQKREESRSHCIIYWGIKANCKGLRNQHCHSLSKPMKLECGYWNPSIKIMSLQFPTIQSNRKITFSWHLPSKSQQVHIIFWTHLTSATSIIQESSSSFQSFSLCSIEMNCVENCYQWATSITLWFKVRNFLSKDTELASAGGNNFNSKILATCPVLFPPHQSTALITTLWRYLPKETYFQILC